MEKVVGINDNRKKDIISKIDKAIGLLEEVRNDASEIGKSCNKIFDKNMMGFFKTSQGLHGLSILKADVEKIQNVNEAEKKYEMLKKWFYSSQNNVESLKGRKFEECWEKIIL